MTTNQFTTITHRGFGKRIFDSLFGALIGVLLFFGSFVLLWMNEGRINWADVARGSTAVDAASVSAASDGKFVAATGALASPEQLGDAAYLQPGPYLHLERRAEMFAWEEKQSSETQGSNTKTTYTYTSGWTSDPQDSSNFAAPAGHSNPQQQIASDEWTVGQAHVGAYGLDVARLELPSGQPVRLNADVLASDAPGTLTNGYLFIGKGSFQTPKIGDMRLSYTAVANGVRVTVFGNQSGTSLEPYMYRGETSFYRAVEGDRTAAIAELQAEYTTMGWILRLVGFLMMWGGMGLMFNPVTSALNLLPVIGTLGSWLIGAITFGVALVLTGITVIIAIIAHNLFALLLVLALIVGGAVFMSRRAQQNRPAAA